MKETEFASFTSAFFSFVPKIRRRPFRACHADIHVQLFTIFVTNSKLSWKRIRLKLQSKYYLFLFRKETKKWLNVVQSRLVLTNQCARIIIIYNVFYASVLYKYVCGVHELTSVRVSNTRSNYLRRWLMMGRGGLSAAFALTRVSKINIEQKLSLNTALQMTSRVYGRTLRVVSEKNSVPQRTRYQYPIVPFPRISHRKCVYLRARIITKYTLEFQISRACRAEDSESSHGCVEPNLSC